MKRLRLRGDWSDTGPNARPEAELSPGQQGTSDSSSDEQSGEGNEHGFFDGRRLLSKDSYYDSILPRTSTNTEKCW